MQWMVGDIHDFMVINSRNNPWEQLILSWITGALSDVSAEMIESSFFKCIQNKIFFILVLHNHFLCFLLLILFFCSKCSAK